MHLQHNINWSHVMMTKIRFQGHITKRSERRKLWIKFYLTCLAQLRNYSSIMRREQPKFKYKRALNLRTSPVIQFRELPMSREKDLISPIIQLYEYLPILRWIQKYPKQITALLNDEGTLVSYMKRGNLFGRGKY